MNAAWATHMQMKQERLMSYLEVLLEFGLIYDFYSGKTA